MLGEVLSHALESERAEVHQLITGAWSLPPEEGRAVLLDLVDRLGRSAPGAADRLARSVEATLTVDTLGIVGPLKERLASVGTCGMAFKGALQWGGPTDGSLQQLAARLKVWLGRTRRLMGWEGLGSLATVLQRVVATTSGADTLK
jgi:hypothetical protein